MASEIYYFSGTGNSLAVARVIAGKINGQLFSIPDLMAKEGFTTQSDTLGIVFPVYQGNLPLIIYRFIGKLHNLGHKYIFAVCTFGDSPGISMGYLNKPTTLSFLESRQLMNCAFWTDENCNGCGICARICPIGNILMDTAKPVWQQRCEQYFACLQWCPKASL